MKSLDRLTDQPMPFLISALVLGGIGGVAIYALMEWLWT